MSLTTTAINAYSNALADFQRANTSIAKSHASAAPKQAEPQTSFADTLRDSLNSVNDLQTEKNQMITSFAAGETQNVHELMISMQKASLAVNLTSAVRNKVLDAYRELSRLQF